MFLSTNSRAEQDAQYTLSQVSMQVDMHKYHFVATSRPSNEGTTSRSNLCIMCIKCKGNGRLEPLDFGLIVGLYKENEYSLEEVGGIVREIYCVEPSVICNSVFNIFKRLSEQF